jgi:hypothetical protein
MVWGWRTMTMTVGDHLHLPISTSSTVVALQGVHQTFIKESIVAFRGPLAFQIADTNVERLSCRGIEVGLEVAFLAEDAQF